MSLRPFLFLALFLGPLSAPAIPRAEPRYFSALPDLPLYERLEEVPDSGLLFDNPSGRIVETFAQGRVSRAEVERFYRRTLPQLGWKPLGKGRFAREGELLALTVREKAGTTTLHLVLSPQ